MRTRTDLYAAAQRSATLLVLLPPSLASIDDFYDQGFVDALRQHHLPVDLLLADVTAQQVVDNTMVSALHTGVYQHLVTCLGKKTHNGTVRVQDQLFWEGPRLSLDLHRDCHKQGRFK